MGLIQLGQQQYHVTETGGGVPILFLHGFTGSAADWETITSKLAANHQLICVDLLGHGLSSAPELSDPYKIEATAADLIMLLDQLDIDQIDLIGYSMGGRLALFIALHYPLRIRRLLLESASPGLAHVDERLARTKRDNELADRIEAHGIESFVARWEQVALFASQSQLPPEVLAAQRERRLLNRPVGLANSLRGMGTGVQPSLWGQLERLDRSVALVTGELDTKFCQIAAQMMMHLPAAQHWIVPQAGHNIHLERPQQFIQAVGDWLQLPVES